MYIKSLIKKLRRDYRIKQAVKIYIKKMRPDNLVNRKQIIEFLIIKKSVNSISTFVHIYVYIS